MCPFSECPPCPFFRLRETPFLQYDPWNNAFEAVMNKQIHKSLSFELSREGGFWLFFFKNLASRLPWQPIKTSDLDKIHTKRRGLLKKHFIKKNVNICSETEINANFHFSHYKSMETLSFQSNESTWAMTIKNILYVETNVMNMYAKFQFHSSYGFWGEDFWIYIQKFTLYVAMETNQIQRFRKNLYEL